MYQIEDYIMKFVTNLIIVIMSISNVPNNRPEDWFWKYRNGYRAG